MPDWAWVHRELRRPNVTLALLWEEYRAGAPDGFGYSWFCDLYRGWAGRLKPTMRQAHLAGEKLFVDFAGRTAEVIDGLTGQIIPVQIFVAVLGASSFTYAEAVWSQKLPDWIAAHVRAFAYFAGAARQTVSDNLKAGIIKACFHEPTVNRTYADMARHYRTAIAKHYYSVPHQLLRQEVEARITAATVEIFHRGKRVASHQRSLHPHRSSTIADHMPSAHRRYRDWTHERIRREAASVGPDTAALVDVILRSRPHPEQGFRSCIGILGLAKRYDAAL
jgi:transposase